MARRHAAAGGRRRHLRRARHDRRAADACAATPGTGRPADCAAARWRSTAPPATISAARGPASARAWRAASSWFAARPARVPASRMRRGLLIVEGAAGAYAASGMIAGTLVICGDRRRLAGLPDAPRHAAARLAAPSRAAQLRADRPRQRRRVHPPAGTCAGAAQRRWRAGWRPARCAGSRATWPVWARAKSCWATANSAAGGVVSGAQDSPGSRTCAMAPRWPYHRCWGRL